MSYPHPESNKTLELAKLDPVKLPQEIQRRYYLFVELLKKRLTGSQNIVDVLQKDIQDTCNPAIEILRQKSLKFTKLGSMDELKATLLTMIVAVYDFYIKSTEAWLFVLWFKAIIIALEKNEQLFQKIQKKGNSFTHETSTTWRTISTIIELFDLYTETTRNAKTTSFSDSPVMQEYTTSNTERIREFLTVKIHFIDDVLKLVDIFAHSQLSYGFYLFGFFKTQLWLPSSIIPIGEKLSIVYQNKLIPK